MQVYVENNRGVKNSGPAGADRNGNAPWINGQETELNKLSLIQFSWSPYLLENQGLKQTAKSLQDFLAFSASRFWVSVE
jgi:hypothetical protein